MPPVGNMCLQAWTAKSFLLASCISTLWRKDSSLDTVETDLPDSMYNTQSFSNGAWFVGPLNFQFFYQFC